MGNIDKSVIENESSSKSHDNSKKEEEINTNTYWNVSVRSLLEMYADFFCSYQIVLGDT
jgi:hypothetical protein